MTLIPQHLNQNHATGICHNEPIAQFEIGSMKNFIYLILCWKTREAAVVDPQKELHSWLTPLLAEGFRLTHILLTHTHGDHVAGVPGLLKLFPSLPVYVHPVDQTRLTLHPESIQSIQDQDKLQVGTLTVEVLHTPGHSSGECCFFISKPKPYLLTGDTVFIRDCGRTDFADGSDVEMFQSLSRIRKLPPETILLPGHHYKTECSTVLEKELLESPPFQCTTPEELASLP